MEFIFLIAILIMSVVIHELAHGYAASYLGDETARYEGRLTLNPIKHLDPMGSFFVPLISYSLGGLIIGWAKPVPYNPYNLRPGRWSEAFVAMAGPASNILIALVFGLFIRFGTSVNDIELVQVFSQIVKLNIVLAIFNLVPIPPLDGSKIIFAFFPKNTYKIRAFYENYGLFFLITFILFFSGFLAPLTMVLYRILTGLSI